MAKLRLNHVLHWQNLDTLTKLGLNHVIHWQNLDTLTKLRLSNSTHWQIIGNGLFESKIFQRHVTKLKTIFNPVSRLRSEV